MRVIWKFLPKEFDGAPLIANCFTSGLNEARYFCVDYKILRRCAHGIAAAAACANEKRRAAGATHASHVPKVAQFRLEDDTVPVPSDGNAAGTFKLEEPGNWAGDPADANLRGAATALDFVVRELRLVFEGNAQRSSKCSNGEHTQADSGKYLHGLT
jgi:hypothetical protein